MPILPDDYLSDYSRFALPLILERFPEWEPFARLMPRRDRAGNVVEFNIPCPSEAVEQGLLLSTANEELSVAFHTHHGHFTDRANRNSPAPIETGLEFAAEIVEDRIGVLSYYREDQFAGSRSIDLPAPDELPDLFKDIAFARELMGEAGHWDRVTLRSWSGRYDREETRG